MLAATAFVLAWSSGFLVAKIGSFEAPILTGRGVDEHPRAVGCRGVLVAVSFAALVPTVVGYGLYWWLLRRVGVTTLNALLFLAVPPPRRREH